MNVGQRAKNQKGDQTIFQDCHSRPGDFQKLLGLSASVSSTAEWGQKKKKKIKNLCLCHRIIVRMKGDKVLANNATTPTKDRRRCYRIIW